MDPIAVTVIVGMAFMLLTPLCMRHPSQRKRYQKMDDRKLINESVHARMMKNRALILAFLGPLPLAFLLGFVSDSGVRTYLACLVILVALLALSASEFFWEILRITRSEIEFRKFQTEKDQATEQGTGADA